MRIPLGIEFEWDEWQFDIYCLADLRPYSFRLAYQAWGITSVRALDSLGGSLNIQQTLQPQ